MPNINDCGNHLIKLCCDNREKSLQFFSPHRCTHNMKINRKGGNEQQPGSFLKNSLENRNLFGDFSFFPLLSFFRPLSNVSLNNCHYDDKT